MTDHNNELPPDVREDLDTLGKMLLALSMADKQTIKDCIKDRTEPPAQLIGLLEAVKVALKYPGARDAIQTALNAPQAFLFNPATDNPADGGDWEEYARTQITIYGMLRREIRDRIAAAIKDPIKRESLDIGDKYIWGTLCALLTFPSDYRQRLAGIFNVAIEDLDTLKEKALKQRAIEIPISDDEYLPGMEPTPEERNALSAVRIYEQQRIQYNVTALRLSSKLDRKASYFPNSGNAYHTLDIVKNKALRIKWNVPAAPDGTPQRVTPYDQEVEAAVSNLVDRCGTNIATYEQIYCMMNGTTPGTYISPKALEDIRHSIRKLNITEIEVIEKVGEDEEEILSGTILDAFEKRRIKTSTGKLKGGFVFARTGSLYAIDKHYNSLLGITREQLNISAGYKAADGTIKKISITTLSVIIRRYLIMEIFRIRNTPSLAPTANKITYDAVIKYEADPDLVEYNPDGTIKTTPAGDRILRRWTNPAEKKSIEKHRKRRRELVLDILGHFQATGLINGFTEDIDPTSRKKTGVIIKVEKTKSALKELKRADDLKRLQGGKK